jgi:hypothetical protein
MTTKAFYHKSLLEKVKEANAQVLAAKLAAQGTMKAAAKAAKTQKAKGIAALRTFGPGLPEINTLDFKLVTKGEDIAEGKFAFPCFVRPCPLVPRHGFVDSRVANSLDEIKKIFKEARKADKSAELIVMPFIEADYNAVWTPGSLSIGPGNDGATAGKNSVAISVAPKPEPRAELLEAGGITDTAYFEFVALSGDIYATQIRNGPPIGSGAGDFIPKPVKVTDVIEASGDLLVWEKKLQSGLPEGTVVYQKGGTRADHYSIHCIINNVPIVFSKKPEVGETLKPSDEKEGFAAAGILEGLHLGFRDEEIPYREAARFVIAVLHNSGYFGKNESRLIGAAAALGVRLGLAACIGEARHKYDGNLARHHVYKRAWRHDNLTVAIQNFNKVRAAFYKLSWPSHSIGGKKWGECADATAILWNSIVAFLKEPEKKNIASIVASLNVIVNQAHNNGWWWNKFVTKQALDVGAHAPAAAALISQREIHGYLTRKAVESFIGNVIADVRGQIDPASVPDRPEKLYKLWGGKWYEVLVKPEGGFELDGVSYSSLLKVTLAIKAEHGQTQTAKWHFFPAYRKWKRSLNKATLKRGNWALGDWKETSLEGITNLVNLPAVKKNLVVVDVTAAQVRVVNAPYYHFQVKLAGLPNYTAFNATLTPAQIAALALLPDNLRSFAGSKTKYKKLTWDGKSLLAGTQVIIKDVTDYISLDDE